MTEYNPPGIDGELKVVIDGGDASEWMAFEKTKFYTNAYIVHDGKLLLGYKKRGFGKNKYNGFGGKVEAGETSLEAASRELEEESGIQSPLKHAGILFFVSEGAQWAFHIDIYRATEYTGTITETEEMKPQWFNLVDTNVSADSRSRADSNILPIPLDSMWESDRHWLPLLLSDRPFKGRADYRLDGDILVPSKWWFGVHPDPHTE